MRAPILLSLGLIAARAFSQSTAPTDPLASRSLDISGVPLVDPPVRDYQNFFNEVKDLGKRPLSADARRSLALSDEELRSLVTVTADLADQAVAFRKIWRPWRFESFMELVESDAVSPALQSRMTELRNEWSQIILDHARRLKAALGEERFHRVEEFMRSGKSMFEVPGA
jgi:hypothetical protein